MKTTMTITATIQDEQVLTLLEVSEQFNIPEQLLLEMEELGLFQSKLTTRKKQAEVGPQEIGRILAACRLHRDLQINLPGVILALELSDELEALKQRLAILEYHHKI